MNKRKNEKTIIAICYDFDGTLAKGNMQEYGFMDNLGISPDEFWQKCYDIRQQFKADKILSYMKCMLDEAKQKDIIFRQEDFAKCGQNIALFKGVVDWFDHINQYAAKKNFIIQHYLISSGLEEIIIGTPIYNKFHKVFAGKFMYNCYGEAIWPARSINFTEKTQYLFRINKGLENWDDNVNAFVPIAERPVPFNKMIYIGDGETDIPCMSTLKENNGYSIAVYQPYCKKAKNMATKLLNEGRVNFVTFADYSAGKPLDRYIKRIIDKLYADEQLKKL